MTPVVLFFTSIPGSKKGVRPILPRIHCSMSKYDFPMCGLKRCHFPIRTCFVMTIKKVQGQSIRGILGVVLQRECFFQRHFYILLSLTAIPRNVFICTTNGSNSTKNVILSEVFYSKNCYVKKSIPIIPINATPQKAKENRMPVPYVLNSEISSTVSGPTESMVEVISISDEEAVMANTSKKSSSLTSTLIVLEFESIYEPISDRISCGDITLLKNEFATVTTPNHGSLTRSLMHSLCYSINVLFGHKTKYSLQCSKKLFVTITLPHMQNSLSSSLEEMFSIR